MSGQSYNNLAKQCKLLLPVLNQNENLMCVKTRYAKFLHLLFFFLIPTHFLFSQSTYEGFGAVTTGGGGPTHHVIHVTTLAADDSPGSLLEALRSYTTLGDSLTIVFDVGGTIDSFRWDSSNEGIDWTYLTIDGSTAPSPGITITGYAGSTFNFEGSGNHDIIIKHIRFRGNPGIDNITLFGAYNVIIDHCSFSGSEDGAVDITEGAHDITVQWCIFGPISPNSSGPMLIAYHPTRNISIHHNLFSSRGAATEGARNPLVHSVNDTNTTNLMADIRNNLVWNWGNSDAELCCGYGYGTGITYGGTANIVNNYYFSTGSEAESAIELNRDGNNSRVYVSGNMSANNMNFPASTHSEWTIPSPAAITTQSPCAAAELVRDSAGVHPYDSLDQAIIDEISLPGCLTVGLNGKVVLQGRRLEYGANWKVPLTVELYATSPTAIVDTYDVITSADGKFSVAGIQPGTYHIAVKNSHTLKKVMASQTLTINNYGFINFDTLYEGDCNGDNYIDGIDASLLLNSYNRAIGNPGYDDRADFTEDGIVSAEDISLIVNNFYKTGDTIPGCSVITGTISSTSCNGNFNVVLQSATGVGPYDIMVNNVLYKNIFAGNTIFTVTASHSGPYIYSINYIKDNNGCYGIPNVENLVVYCP